MTTGLDIEIELGIDPLHTCLDPAIHRRVKSPTTWMATGHGEAGRPDDVRLEPPMHKFHSIGWFNGKIAGNHRFSHGIWDIPVFFPLNQSIDP